MRILAIDPSKKSAGWACFSLGDARPTYGHWELASEFTSEGKLYCNMQQNIFDLHKLGAISHIFIEDAFTVALRAGNNNIQWLKDISGLIAHVKSLAEAMGCRQIREVPLETWRAHFIGGTEVKSAKQAARLESKLRAKKVSASNALKELVIIRCEQLGLSPKVSDEADALGILDYACDWHGITPPWRRDEILRPPLGA